MADQGGSFQSLEELRKHWSSRATSKRKQTEQTTERKHSQANGESTSYAEQNSSETRVAVSGVPAVLDGRFGQAWVPGQRDGNGSYEPQPEEGEKATDASESEEECASDRHSAHESKPRRATEAGARQPPSLSVMRPLGDYGTTLDLPAQSPRNIARTSAGSKQGSSRQAAAKPPAFAGAAAASQWKQRQTSQQLSSGIAGLGKQVLEAKGQQEKEQAILKLYAVFCQTTWVAQPGLSEEWTAGYLGLLELGLPRFVKHVAALVLRRDKGYSDLVRSMAAAVLKNLMKWMEGHTQADQPDSTHALVTAALESILMDGAPSARAGSRAVRQTGGAEDSMAGYGNLLDTDALEGLLDPEATPGTRRGSQRGGNAAMETNQMFGSLMDTGSLEALVSQGRAPRRGSTTGSQLMGTHMLSSFGSALDTTDVAGHMMEHKGALRATIWLFKSDQADAWCAAASLVGSIGLLGAAEIDAMGGPKLVKPLMWVLRNGEAQSKCAAMRALSILSQDIACRTVMARQDKYLRAMVRILQGTDAAAKNMAVSTLNMLLAHDPSTHWVLARSGIVPALVEIIKQPLGAPAVNADATMGLKHLTSSSQRNREALLQAQGVPHLIRLIKEGNTDAQYNSARILRHLAMGGSASGKSAVCQAIPALVYSLKVGRPRVCFACAAALAMVTEGQPSACDAIYKEGGIKALVRLLVKGGGQGKKVAAEALQAMAAESEEMRPKIAAAGCIKPLVQMLHVGNLQQQAAAAGAVQAIAYCPSSPSSLAGALAAQGVVQPLVKILNTAPRAMRCAAAGALCNLALRDPAIQGQIVDAGALEALVELLSDAQPDGQYSAAAALVNLSAVGQEVRAQIVDAGALSPLLVMLTAESWYCRIVAAELIALLGCDGGLEREQLVAPSTLGNLVALLCLQHTPGTLEEVGGDVAHLAYERSQDIIVMKGYKFARAKVAAAAALGVIGAQDADAATVMTREGGVAEELTELLPTGRTHVRLTAAGAITDLARSSLEARNAFLLADAGHRLVSLIKRAVLHITKPGKQVAMAEPPGLADAAAAAAALLELVRSDEAAASSAVAEGIIPPLLFTYQHGEQHEALAAYKLLRALHDATPTAKKALKGSGQLDAVLASQEPLVGPQGTTASILQRGLTQQVSGYAITAKPSANLYILLQVPFEALLPPGQPSPVTVALKPRTTSGKRKSRRQPGESREGGKEPAMAPVNETEILETDMNSMSLADEYEINAKNYWQPSEQPSAKSRTDILETWTDAEPRAA